MTHSKYQFERGQIFKFIKHQSPFFNLGHFGNKYLLKFNLQSIIQSLIKSTIVFQHPFILSSSRIILKLHSSTTVDTTGINRPVWIISVLMIANLISVSVHQWRWFIGLVVPFVCISSPLIRPLSRDCTRAPAIRTFSLSPLSFFSISPGALSR